MTRRTRITSALVALGLGGLWAVGTQPATTAAAGGDEATDGCAAPADDQGGGSGSVPVIDPGDGGDYQVDIDPARFTSVVDNPYFPALPGTRWSYVEVSEDGGFESIAVEVLDERRVVMGVETIVVHDVVTDADGEVIEDTYDWFAQDDEGSVWYFGEDTTAYDEGEPSSAGSWEAGVGGALPGVVMAGDPQVGDGGYRQEYLAGEAEDMACVIEVGGADFAVPAGVFDDVVRTRDWTPLEPGAVEEKTYAPDVGWIHEVNVDEEGVVSLAVLTSFDAG